MCEKYTTFDIQDKLYRKEIAKYIRMYGKYILEKHQVLKDVLYIYEALDIEVISNHIRNILDVMTSIENIETNINYITYNIDNLTYGVGIATNEIINEILLETPCLFISLIKQYSKESIEIVLGTHNDILDHYRKLLEIQKVNALQSIPKHRNDVMKDLIEIYRQYRKREWLVRNISFSESLEKYGYQDIAMWNRQNCFDSYGVLYLIDKASEKQFTPLETYKDDILDIVYLKFGILCGMEDDIVDIVYVPHYLNWDIEHENEAEKVRIL